MNRGPTKPKARVLFLEQQSWRAGGERVLEGVLRSMGDEFEPLVAFPEDGPLVAEFRRRSIETIFFPLGRYRSGKKSWADMIAFPLRSLWCAARLARVIRQREVRLVYINSPRCLVAGVLAARLTGTPSLFHQHITLTRGPDLLVATWAARNVTKTVACSETAAASLSGGRANLKRAIQVIHNPIRRPVWSETCPTASAALAATLAASELPVVGVVARVTPHKGQHVLLQAVAKLSRRGRRVRVVFIGAPEENNHDDASYLRSLRSRAQELGLEGKVHWVGYVEDPNPFYAIMDILVVPSTASFEGLPLVALEALQWGVPVIGSQVGGVPEVVLAGENGLLVPAGDADALADCIERLLRDPELRAKLQDGARASVDGKFSIESFRKNIRQVLCELTGSVRSVNSRESESPVLGELEYKRVQRRTEAHTETTRQ